jgi:hypothetical protein
MKMEYEISDYEHKIVIPENMSSLALKRVDGPGFPGWKIDLYSHFKRLQLLRENNALHMVDLEPHYKSQGQNPDDKGWMIDDLEKVVDKLQYIRFFNRFDKATLY